MDGSPEESAVCCYSGLVSPLLLHRVSPGASGNPAFGEALPGAGGTGTLGTEQPDRGAPPARRQAPGGFISEWPLTIPGRLGMAVRGKYEKYNWNYDKQK